MSAFVYDNSLTEDREAREPEKVDRGMVGIRLSRRGLSYKKVLKEEYKIDSFSTAREKTPFISELPSPPYFKEEESLCFYRKRIRDGYVCVCDGEKKSWWVFSVSEGSYRYVTDDGSEATAKLSGKIKKSDSKSLLLPYEDRYLVAWSPICWTRDFINKVIKNADSGDSLFTTVDVRQWKKAVKSQSPGDLPPGCVFEEDYYELRETASSSLFRDIHPSDEEDFHVTGNPSGSARYSKKQQTIYCTIDDTLGVVEDLRAEMISLLLYKKSFSEAVSNCEPMSRLGGMPEDEAETHPIGEVDAMLRQDLYASAVILYNMLYSDGGALNRKEHRRGHDGGHKYRSLVQEYKFTKLLAVSERHALQKRYGALRDRFGDILTSREYKKEMESFHKQSEMITFTGQMLAMDHVRILSIKPDCFDADISLSQEGEEDGWRQLIEGTVLAYMGADNGEISDKDSAVVRLLRERVSMERLLKTNGRGRKALAEGKGYSVKSLTELFMETFSFAVTSALSIMQSREKGYVDLCGAIDKLLAENRSIMEKRKVMASGILEKYKIPNSEQTIAQWLDDKGSKKMSRRRSSKRKQKLQRAMESARTYQRQDLMRNKRLIDRLEVECLRINEKLPPWLDEAKTCAEGFEKLLTVVNITLIAKELFDKLKEEEEEEERFKGIDALYYGLLIYGVSFDYVKQLPAANLVNDKLYAALKIRRGVKLTKFLRLSRTLLSDILLFTAGCVDSYRMLKKRNTEAAVYNTVSSALSLMSAACLSGIALTGVTGIGLVVLLVGALVFAAGSYYTGERAKDKEYDLWQSFLICSIFSNYQKKGLYGGDRGAMITESVHATHYDVAYELYSFREEIAVNDYYYKDREYDLQDFTETRLLLDEMATCFEVGVSVDKLDFSFEAKGNFIIPTNLSVEITYFGGAGYNQVEYFLDLDVFPQGNGLGVVTKNLFEMQSDRDPQVVTEQGQSKITLSFNIWKDLHTIKENLANNEETAQVLIKEKILTQDKTQITYPSNGRILFGCRLVNSRQEMDAPSGERAYLPWEEDETAIFLGFKSRIFIPEPADAGDFSARYYREFYGHMTSGRGSEEELKALEIRGVKYKKKAIKL